jgi:ribosomal-protein-alanine N-acetyltransferase
MSELVVRPMAGRDLEQVTRLDVMSFPKPWPRSAYERELENPRARCWVIEAAVEDGLEFPSAAAAPALPSLTVPPGGVAVVALLVYWLVVGEAHVATLAVHPSFRRQGLGRLILLQALREALAEGARVAYLEVRESNVAAQELYREFGFEPVGRRNRYYGSEDAVLMTLEPLDTRALAGVTHQEEQP